MEHSRLPISVLLQVVQFNDVPTIQSFRLASKAIYELINTYQTSIFNIVLQRCYDEVDVHHYASPYRCKPTIRLLLQVHHRIQITEWLAGVAVEQHDGVQHLNRGYLTDSENISALDPRGDAIRARVQVGWSVFWRLTDIAKMIKGEREHLSEINDSHIRTNIDESIHQARKKYLKGLPFRELIDYMLMKMVMESAFCDIILEDPKFLKKRKFFMEHDEADMGDGSDEFHRIGKHWLEWLFLDEGPLFIQQVWSSLEGNRNVRHIISEE
ncbi:MAG: hypothetical protein Q9191_002261 [Dirinaria sp. TL-2023a]